MADPDPFIPEPDPYIPAPVTPSDDTKPDQKDEPAPEVETTLPGGEVAPPPEEVVSPIQVILKDAMPDEDYVDWIERIDAPEYASNLYDVLSAGADSTGGGLASCLVKDDYFVVDPNAPWARSSMTWTRWRK